MINAQNVNKRCSETTSAQIKSTTTMTYDHNFHHLYRYYSAGSFACCTLIVIAQRLHQFTRKMTPVQRPPGRLECGEPSMCDSCFWAYPPGCLHTIQECERNSPQMNGIMDAFERYTQCCDTNPGRAVLDQF